MPPYSIVTRAQGFPMNSFWPDSTPRKVLFAFAAAMFVFMVYCVVRAKTDPRRVAATMPQTHNVTAPAVAAPQ